MVGVTQAGRRTRRRRTEEELADAVREHSASLWRLAVSRLGDPHEAEDAVQETFLRAHRGHDSWREEASLRTWLHTICRNVCVDRLRRRRVDTIPLDFEDHRTSTDTDHTGAVAVRLALEEGLVRLPEAEREAFVLVDVLGFSGEEAARICGVPATTLRSRLHRAHRSLVTHMRKGEVR